MVSGETKVIEGWNLDMQSATTKKMLVGQIMITLFVLSAAFFVVSRNLSNQIEIYYYGNNSSSYQDEVSKIYYDYGTGYQETDSTYVQIFKRLARHDYKNKDNLVQRVRIDFKNGSRFGIDRIEIRSGMFCTYAVSGRELYENGYFAGCSNVEIEGNHIWVTPESDTVMFSFSDATNLEFVSKLQEDKWGKAGFLCIFAFLLFLTYAFVFFCLKQKISDRYYIIFSYLIFFATILVVLMATMSITYGHPDEDETRGSIDYYLTNWGLPDFDDSSLENSFSNYGTIRLTERTLYYFFAGKIGLIFKELFHVSAYYRMFNVLLFVILVLYTVVKARKHKWLFCVLGLTPQLWYIFSYATSDAWDYFLAFFVITGVVLPDSCISKALQGSWEKKQWLRMIFYALLCSQVFASKDNYYLILLLAFLILLIRLLKEKERKQLFVRYMFILSITLLIFGMRVGIDEVRYDGTKNEQYREARIEHISEEIEEKESFRDQGLTISDAYTYQRGFATYMFESFTGCYGWMTLSSNYYYYHLMAILYILMLFYIYTNMRDKRKAFCITGACFLLYFVTLYHAWTVDYQAQGRYLLPCILGLGYLVAESDVAENKKFQKLAVLVLVAGQYSFIRYGILQMVKL